MSKIDEMNAQELNEAILRALGYEKLPFPAIPQWQKPGGQLFNIPQYSTSIAAAWELVEDMNAHGYTVNIQIDHNGTTVFVKERGIVTRESPIDATFAKITPEAISRAWLKWQENRNG